ncbi:MAG: GNAT family N-acetyltransferase [Candidatus Dormibacteria bacterium]
MESLPAALDAAAAFRRLSAFSQKVARQSATDVVAVRGGFAVLSPEFSASYEHNCLFITEPVPPAQLVSEADRVLGGAGLEHRCLELALERVEPGWLREFAEQGYRIRRTLAMAVRGPSQRSPRAPVERVDYAQVRDLATASWRRSLPQSSDDVIRQLVDRRRLTERACRVSHHLVRSAAGPVSRCELYLDPPTAQVESVETEPEWQGRGFAAAVVLDAIALARDSGCDLIFLYADADDWPQQLYRHLGFEAVGMTHTLERGPDLPVGQ